jgi:hypothetical protein
VALAIFLLAMLVGAWISWRKAAEAFRLRGIAR